MVLYKIILTLSMITVVYSLPFDDNKENNSTEGRGISVNDIFKQINVILEQNIQSAIGDSSVEVGDNFTSGNKDGGVQITVEKFEYGVDKFPVTFQPDHDDGSLEVDDLVPLEGDYDETLIFKETVYDTDEGSNSAFSTDTTTVDSQDDEAITEKSEPSTSKSSTANCKDKDKLLKDVAEQPILTTV